MSGVGFLPDALFGIGDLGEVFGDHAKVLLPWPAAPRLKRVPLLTAEVEAALRRPPVVCDVDPRLLHATQPWVVHQHAAYYRTGEWERTGRPSADRSRGANRWPLVSRDCAGRLVLLGGHHRALAALVEGRPLRARVVFAAVDAPIAVTPRLFVGARPKFDHVAVATAAEALVAIESGATALVGGLDVAADTLRCLGLTAVEVEDRLVLATTGRSSTAN